MKFTPVTGGRPVWSNTYYYYISLSVSTSPSVRLIIFQGRSNYNDPPAPPPPAYSPLHFAWWSRAKLSSENYNSKIRLLNKTKSFLSPDTPLWLCIQNLNLSVHHFEPDNFQWFALFSFKFQSTRKYFTEEELVVAVRLQLFPRTKTYCGLCAAAIMCLEFGTEWQTCSATSQ